jgi:hypothetical protein
MNDAALEAEPGESDKPKEPTLAEAVYNITTGPSGATMCCCRNRNAVNAGLERACGYCELRAALATESRASVELDQGHEWPRHIPCNRRLVGYCVYCHCVAGAEQDEDEDGARTVSGKGKEECR